MNPFLVVTKEGGSLADIITLSITGIVVVILGLFFIAFVVSLFKHIFNEENEEPTIEETSETKIGAKINKSLFFDVSKLDENQMAAIFAALTIEIKLYHENEPEELAFKYQPRNISGWTMAGIIKD